MTQEIIVISSLRPLALYKMNNNGNNSFSHTNPTSNLLFIPLRDCLFHFLKLQLSDLTRNNYVITWQLHRNAIKFPRNLFHFLLLNLPLLLLLLRIKFQHLPPFWTSPFGHKNRLLTHYHKSFADEPIIQLNGRRSPKTESSMSMTIIFNYPQSLLCCGNQRTGNSPDLQSNQRNDRPSNKWTILSSDAVHN